MKCLWTSWEGLKTPSLCPEPSGQLEYLCIKTFGTSGAPRLCPCLWTWRRGHQSAIRQKTFHPHCTWQAPVLARQGAICGRSGALIWGQLPDTHQQEPAWGPGAALGAHCLQRPTASQAAARWGAPAQASPVSDRGLTGARGAQSPGSLSVVLLLWLEFLSISASPQTLRMLAHPCSHDLSHCPAK